MISLSTSTEPARAHPSIICYFRDKYQKSKGKNQYEQKGVIRFELMYNCWCEGHYNVLDWGRGGVSDSNGENVQVASGRSGAVRATMPESSNTVCIKDIRCLHLHIDANHKANGLPPTQECILLPSFTNFGWSVPRAHKNLWFARILKTAIMNLSAASNGYFGEFGARG